MEGEACQGYPKKGAHIVLLESGHVKGKMKPPIVDFQAGLKTLREKLGLTQEGMALRLGASVGTYRKWEAGAFNPSGPWLIKILEACPDDETRALLGAPPAPKLNYPPASPPAISQEPPPPTRGTLMGRYRNVCIEGIELLYDLARGGSDVARDHLHSIAEAVTRTVGSLTRAELDDATRSQRGPATSRAPSSAHDETPHPATRRKPAR
jgi:putative transcriptional regulator